MANDPSYTIGRKEEFRKMDLSNEVLTWYRIYATSKGGTYFHIEVKESDLGTAPALLAAKAKQLDSI